MARCGHIKTRLDEYKKGFIDVDDYILLNSISDKTDKIGIMWGWNIYVPEEVDNNKYVDCTGTE